MELKFQQVRVFPKNEIAMIADATPKHGADQRGGQVVGTGESGEESIENNLFYLRFEINVDREIPPDYH